MRQVSADPEVWETKYLRIAKMIEKPKTSVYGVFSRSSADLLGSIYWEFGWRQYVFEVAKLREKQDRIIWSRSCLDEIRNFLQLIMDKRKTSCGSR